jgi:hypothetical protein
MIEQSIKDHIKALVKADKPFQPYEKPRRITVEVGTEGYRERSRVVSVSSGLYTGKTVVYAEDCFELAYYFKKLGEKLAKAAA